ncbi:MAG: anti-sigma factor family protein [Fimbriimonadales bacterium]
MSCERFERQLWAYLEGRLSSKDAQALEAHLQSCVRCQRQLMAARATYRALRVLPRHRAPAHLAEGVRRRLSEVPSRPRIDWARVWRRVALAPALGLLVGAAWWGWQAQQAAAPVQVAAEDTAESLVELHEQLEVADWSPSPTASYFISTGYTR